MAALPGPPAVPRATIRLQFNKDFGFDQAAALVPYFARLGISHIYASPFLQARSGSVHGYDIISHSTFNPEIGDAAAFERLTEALHGHAMGLILDFVPNHMGVGGSDNGWWLDVLEWGEASPYAAFFDIDWAPIEPSMRGKLLLPVLGDQYGRVLEGGELQLRFDPMRGSFSVWYYTHRFPIAVRHYPRILRPVLAELGDAGASLGVIVDGFAGIGTGGETVQQQAILRREADDLKARLAALADSDPTLAEAIERAVARLNGTPGERGSFHDLHRLLEDQSYRVAFWRVAADEINYRRFFDINDLAGLRMEIPELFELTHQLVFRLIAEGKLQGLRIDHIDGLYDPRAYCERVRDRAAYLLIQADTARPAEGVPDQPALHLPHPLYLIVEKILARHEPLRTDWPVSGTTGYEFMNLVCGLFVDPAGEAALTETYTRFLGREPDLDEMMVEAKRQMVESSLASELNVLAVQLHRLAQQSWLTRDYTRTGMRRALAGLVSHFPVYRTYISPEHAASEEDRRYLDWATARAQGIQSARHLDLRLPSRRADRGSGPAPGLGLRGAGRVPHRDEVPAVHRPGDGQGGGGHPVLPLSAPGLAQRGGRRTGEVRHQPGGVPPHEPGPAAPTPLFDGRHRHP